MKKSGGGGQSTLEGGGQDLSPVFFHLEKEIGGGGQSTLGGGQCFLGVGVNRHWGGWSS